MRAVRDIKGAAHKLAILLLIVVIQSCGTYNSKTAEVENDLYSGNFGRAIENIDKNKFLLKDRNRLLYLLEKGKLEHLSGNYKQSNELLEQAYILIDDRIKTNVGQEIASKFTNPMAEPYKGEDFEKVTLHYYKALNYFALGMPAEALVEAKRINIKLYELNQNYKENKNKYSEDAFSQILQGILYEATGDINNAFIAYRNAELIYTKNEGKYFGVPMPQQLKDDLLRTSRQLGFTQEYEGYKKQFGIKKDAAPGTKPMGEAIVFWENGLSPAKDQTVITVSAKYGAFVGTYNDGEVAEEIIIPIPPGVDLGFINAIAIPKYRVRESYYNKAAVLVNGQEIPFELAQDFNTIAKQSLKDRMMRETIDLALRFATKKASSEGLARLGKELLGDTGGEIVKLGADVAGAATEKADSRNWQSLPSTISYVRIPLREGENKFIIKKYGPQGIDVDTLHIPYKHGLQLVNYFDLGRTQVMPSATPGAANAAGEAGWDPWQKTACYSKIQFRIRQDGKLGEQFRWKVQFRSDYIELISFNYHVTNKVAEHTITTHRKTLRPREVCQPIEMYTTTEDLFILTDGLSLSPYPEDFEECDQTKAP